MQQVKPAKFGEREEEGLNLSWDDAESDAESYMEEHGLAGDRGLYVDKAQEEYVSNLDLGEPTHNLSRQYSEWSAKATVVLASKSDHTLADITKNMGYGQRA
eukprot:1353315-Karenia_brevis.AAC.1